MSENRIEVLVGAAVLAVAVGFLAWAGKDRGFAASLGTYPLHASFRSAEGISAGSDVRMAGVKIGSVTDIKLDPKSFFADMSVAIDKGIELPDDSQIIVASEGLLGGAYVEILPGGSLDNFKPGDEIEDTQGAVSMLGLLMKFVGSGVSKTGDESGAGAAGSSAAPGSDAAPGDTGTTAPDTAAPGAAAPAATGSESTGTGNDMGSDVGTAP